MDYKAEGIKPYDEETDKTTQVREMFDSIAPAYDTMNRTMTLGIDRSRLCRGYRFVGRHVAHSS